MGGGIARAAAETPGTPYAGVVIVAGAGGDLPTRMARQARLAELWPAIDPKAHPGLSATDPKVVAFADAIGTPVAARRLWPYTAAGAVRGRRRDDASAGRRELDRPRPGADDRGRRHLGRLRHHRTEGLPRQGVPGRSPPPLSGRRGLAHVGRRRRHRVVPVHRHAHGTRSATSPTRWAKGRRTSRRYARRSIGWCAGSSAAKRRRRARP